MGKVLLSSLLCLSLLLAVAPVASADLCVNLGGFIFHGRGVAQPGAGACNIWKGYVHGGCANASDPYTTGTVCGSSDNTKIHGSLNSSCNDASTNVVVDNFTYARVGGAGAGIRYNVMADPPFNFAVAATKVVCPANSIPAAVTPGGTLGEP